MRPATLSPLPTSPLHRRRSYTPATMPIDHALEDNVGRTTSGDEGESRRDTTSRSTANARRAKKRGRPRLPPATAVLSPDASPEAIAAAERLEKRRRQNRESAAVCRRRHKNALAEAQREVVVLKADNHRLTRLSAALDARLKQLEQAAAEQQRYLPTPQSQPMQSVQPMQRPWGWPGCVTGPSAPAASPNAQWMRAMASPMASFNGVARTPVPSMQATWQLAGLLQRCRAAHGT